MIKFKNGSKIIPIKNNSEIIRSNRSKLITFYCSKCNIVHVDMFVGNVIVLENEIICQEVNNEN